MTDIRALAERLRQIAESQRMDFDSPHVALTLDESAAALEAQEAKITEALALHQPMKIWESDRSYTLACRECALKLHPCPTARILSADAPTEPLIECPHWEPGRITMRKGCTACSADIEFDSSDSF